jgi:hypothetical protein
MLVMPPTGSQSSPTERDDDQHHPDPEDRGRVEEEGQGRDDRVRDPPGMARREEAQRAADADREANRGDHEEERRRQPLEDELGHGQPLAEGEAEIERDDVLQVVEELDMERLVEAELPAQRRHVFGRGGARLAAITCAASPGASWSRKKLITAMPRTTKTSWARLRLR